MHSIAIFGGTFDPIHYGHLKTSQAIQSYFRFDCYTFLPCKTPVLKPPSLASTEQRIAMLQKAIKNYPFFSIDLREIKRDSPSYIVDTLKSFRNDNNDASITLIIGYDSFLSLTHWHEWDKLINLANLIVINRNQYNKPSLSTPIKQLLTAHQTTNKEDLLKNQSGSIYLFNAGNYDISSTDIRLAVKENRTINDKLPETIIEYIKEQRLYR